MQFDIGPIHYPKIPLKRDRRPPITSPNVYVQTDLPYASGNFYILPKHLPGRVNVDDFVFFRWPSTMNQHDYMVAIDSLDTSHPSGHIRTIGELQHNVELPQVIFDAYASIYVLPKVDSSKPSFYSRLNRGSTYIINDVSKVHTPGARYQMDRHGILRAGTTSSILPTAY